MDGIPRYDNRGKPICNICNKSFDRLLRHVNQTHGMTSAEYREQFGFCKTFAFISTTSRQKVSQKTKSRRDIIQKNLIVAGAKTRFLKNQCKCKHVITPQRLLIIENNRNQRKSNKP